MSNALRTDEAFLADKDAARWSEVLGRAFCPHPQNIDEMLMGLNDLAGHGVGGVEFPLAAGGAETPPCAPSTKPAIGVLLADEAAPMPMEEVGVLAARYAALAIEKQCEIIILSHQHTAGFERFGFRVERIAGDTTMAREACLLQLRSFWEIEILI